MKKGYPRLIIPVTLQFAIRYLLRSNLIEKIGEFAIPVIVLAWEDPVLEQEFKQLGIEVYMLPKQNWEKEYIRLRKKIDIWHLKQVNSPSTPIDERRNAIDLSMKQVFFRKLQILYTNIYLSFPVAQKHLLNREKDLFFSKTNYFQYKNLIDSLQGDALFSLTPFHRDEEMLVRAAQAAGIPLITAIHSFDNLTTRGWIPVKFDAYLLWNQYNAAELVRIYPETALSQISIVGTPQFDFYWDDSYCWEEQRWRKELKLPSERQVLLFGGGPPSIVPHEPHFLWQLDQAIENGELPNKPIILFRRHPVDKIERWESTLANTKHVICDTPWQPGESSMHFNVRRFDIERLVSTLYHSHVHINTSSTMAVDGAIFDRPQVGPAYDDRPGRKYDRISQELYLREHYLPITNSGGLSVVYNRDELISAVREGLLNPGAKQEGRKKIVQEICAFTDGRSTQRVATELSRFLGINP